MKPAAAPGGPARPETVASRKIAAPAGLADDFRPGRVPTYAETTRERLLAQLDQAPPKGYALTGTASLAPALAAAGSHQPPDWETMRIANDGKPVVKAWRDGTAVLTLASGKTFHAAAANLPAPQELSGGWNLSFPPDWGAPPSVTLEKLISWPEHTNAGVKYFSGTASYEK